MKKSINIPDGLGCTLHVVSQVAEVRVVFRLFVFLLLQITRQTLQRAGRLSVLVIDIRVRGWGFPRNSVRGYPTALSAYMTTCIVFVHSKRFPTPNRRSSEDSFHLLAHTHTHTPGQHTSVQGICPAICGIPLKFEHVRRVLTAECRIDETMMMVNEWMVLLICKHLVSTMGHSIYGETNARFATIIQQFSRTQSAEIQLDCIGEVFRATKMNLLISH